MKKQYLIYALLCIYGCPTFTMESRAESEQTEQRTNTSENTATTKKPTMRESWRKVLTLRWRELGKADAWNIGAPVAAIATLGLYYYLPKGPQQPGNNPGGPNNPDGNNPDDDNPLFDRINELRRRNGISDESPFTTRINELRRQQREQEELRRHQEELRRQREQELRRARQQEEDDLAEAIRQSLESTNNKNVGTDVPSEEQTVVNQPAAPEADCIMCLDKEQCVIMPCCQATCCPGCLMENLEACLYKNSTREILCPNVNCAHRHMEESTIRSITWTNGRKDLYVRYSDIALNECLDNDQSIKQCRTPNCNNRIITDIERNRQFAHCQGCNQQYCSHCLLNHANNITCAQAARDLEIAQNPTLAEQANQEFIRNNTKQCPNCRHGIEKNGGCNHMTCRRCNHEFCWTCLARYGSTRCNSGGCAGNNGFNF